MQLRVYHPGALEAAVHGCGGHTTVWVGLGLLSESVQPLPGDAWPSPQECRWLPATPCNCAPACLCLTAALPCLRPADGRTEVGLVFKCGSFNVIDINRPVGEPMAAISCASPPLFSALTLSGQPGSCGHADWMHSCRRALLAGWHNSKACACLSPAAGTDACAVPLPPAPIRPHAPQAEPSAGQPGACGCHLVRGSGLRGCMLQLWCLLGATLACVCTWRSKPPLLPSTARLP